MVMPLRVAWSSVSDLTVNEVGANEEERRPIGAMLAADDTGERTDMRPLLDTAACKGATARIRGKEGQKLCRVARVCKRRPCAARPQGRRALRADPLVQWSRALATARRAGPGALEHLLKVLRSP